MSALRNNSGLPGVLCLLIVLLMPIVTGCGPARETPAADSPEPSEHGTRVAPESNQLAFELFLKLYQAAPGENVITAPLSISAMLAMLLEGARGQTAEELAGVLKLDTGSKAPADFGRLLQYVAEEPESLKLVTAAAVWPDKGYPVKDQFAETMKGEFGAGVEALELSSPNAAETIDKWVKDKTAGRIEKMSDALNLPNPYTVMVLINAIYFKGSWTHEFEVEDTEPAPFTLADGTEVEVPMMAQKEDFQFGEADRFRMLRLPYGEEERFAMDILLPEEGYPLGDFTADLSRDSWSGAVSSLAESEVDLQLPRFELRYRAVEKLTSSLMELGMPLAFSKDSDFTGISPEDPWVGTIAHKTYVRVDEKGTEAAGTTATGMTGAAPGETAVSFTVDRPFAFVISDTESQAILFMGLIADPRGSD
jgi:serpin B